ncbi:hypothetical protein [Kitasatospora sp. NPDC059327]|uniref:glycosyl hydrolase family 95 catalytic domain-containing protein n=1 Tax=Kitasatospora sp. NPDC059327 TaxID=3346803 RepID=UPI0036D02EC4
MTSDQPKGMTRRTSLAILIAAAVAVGVDAPVYATAPLGCGARPSDPDEWARVSSIVDRHRVVYDGLPSGVSPDLTPDGPLMGNGTVNAFMGGDRQTQKIFVTRSDMWEDYDHPDRDVHATTFGGLTISSATSAAGGTFRYTQDLRTGVVEATSEGGFGTKTWLSAKKNLIVTEIVNQGQTDLVMSVDVWTEPATVNSISTTSGGLDRVNGLIHAGKEAKSDKYHWSVNVAIASKVLYLSPVLKEVDGRTMRMTFPLECGKSVTVVSSVEGGKGSATYIEDAKKTVLAHEENKALAAAKSVHDEWWKEYWLKSYVDFGSASARLEKLYYGQLYMLGCAIAAQSEHSAGLTAGLFPWCTSTEPRWQGDYTLNTDIQRAMHSSIGANRTDHIKNYSNVIEDFWPVARSLAADKKQLNHLVDGRGHPPFESGIRGALFPTHIGPWGSRTEHSNGPDDFFHSPSNGAAVLQPLVKYWKYTQDSPYLRKFLYPKLKDLAQFWEDYLVWDSTNGRYVVYGASFEESTEGKNAILDLMASHFVFENAIAASKALGIDAADRGRWSYVLDRLSSYPTGAITSGPGIGKTTFVEYEGADPQIHSHPVVVQGTYFFDTVGRTDQQYAEFTRNHIRYMQKWNSDKAMRAAVVGTNAGYEIDSLVNSVLAEIIDLPVSDWLGMRSNNTYGDLGATLFVGFIHGSLLQSDEGFLNIFANWYKDRATSFTRLRASGAFLVDAEQDEGGVATTVSILSEKGKRLTVLNPWPNKKAEVLEDGTVVSYSTSVNSLGELLTFPTRAGARYELRVFQ